MKDETILSGIKGRDEKVIGYVITKYARLLWPVAAAVLALFLFGEIPVPLQILGGILILGGVLYYSRIEKAE